MTHFAPNAARNRKFNLSKRVSNIYLISFNFDKFFEPVNDEELMVFIVLGDVAGVKPAVRSDRWTSSFRVIQITFHNLKEENFESILSDNYIMLNQRHKGVCGDYKHILWRQGTQSCDVK